MARLISLDYFCKYFHISSFFFNIIFFISICFYIYRSRDFFYLNFIYFFFFVDYVLYILWNDRPAILSSLWFAKAMLIFKLRNPVTHGCGMLFANKQNYDATLLPPCVWYLYSVSIGNVNYLLGVCRLSKVLYTNRVNKILQHFFFFLKRMKNKKIKYYLSRFWLRNDSKLTQRRTIWAIYWHIGRGW